jgi:hypothetical protein
MTIAEAQFGIASLRERLTGTVFLPGDLGWDAARQAYNLTID